MHRVVRGLVLRVLRGGGLVLIDDLRPPGDGVLLLHRLELGHDELFDAAGVVHDVLEVGDLLLQPGHLLNALEDVLLVDVAQLDVGHVLGLHAVDAEADHQVGHHLVVLLGLPDDFDGPVDVQQDLFQAAEQVQLVLLLLHHEVGAPPHPLHAPARPLVQNLPHPHHPGHARDEDVEIAGEGVLEGGGAEELGHQLVRIGPPLEVDGDLEAVQIGLVPHVGDLPDLAPLHQLGHLVHDGLHRGGVGDLVDLDEVFALEVAPLGPHLEGAAARLIDLPKGPLVVEQLAAGGEVGGLEVIQQVHLGVLQKGHRGVAHLAQVEAAQVGGHAHGDALVGAHQHVGEGGGQQGGLLHGAVVVVHKVHRVLVDVAEQLGADGVQPHLGVPAGRPGHVPGVHLAEVALGVHQGVEQGPVTPAEAHHGVVDGRVAVGVELHGLAHHVGALGAGAPQQVHLVHGVKQLAVGGLEPVDLRDGPGDDDAHGVGHVVDLQRLGDGLLQHLGPQAHDVGVVDLLCPLLGGLLFGHWYQSLFRIQFRGLLAIDWRVSAGSASFRMIGPSRTATGISGRSDG